MRRQRKTPARWGIRAGAGELRRGAVGNQTCLGMHRNAGRVHTNFLQLFVSKVNVNFVARLFNAANSSFMRDAANFVDGHAEKESSPSLGNVFRNFLIIVHGVLPHAGIKAMPSSSTPKIIVL